MIYSTIFKTSNHLGGGKTPKEKRKIETRRETLARGTSHLQTQSISATICAAQHRNSKSEQTFPLVLDAYAVLFVEDCDYFVGLGAETTAW